VVALLVFSSLLGVLGGAPEDSPTPTPTPSPSVAPSVPASVSPSVAETSAAGSPSLVPVATPEPSQTTYVVKEGDTLNDIAVLFGTTADAIRNANGITGDTINVGQVLIIP
jgi:LysM repeat protein